MLEKIVEYNFPPLMKSYEHVKKHDTTLTYIHSVNLQMYTINPTATNNMGIHN